MRAASSNRLGSQGVSADEVAVKFERVAATWRADDGGFVDAT